MSTAMTSNNPVAPPHEVIVASDYPDQEARLRQQCYDVRAEVFCTEQGFSLELEIDENDATATHLLLRLTPSLSPIGTLRLYPAPDGSHLILGRVAILAAYRKYGLGKVLMLAGHERAVRQPYLIQPSLANPPVDSGASEGSIPATNTLDSSPSPNGEAADRSTITVKLGAQIYAIPFYARYGYVAEGDTYLDEGAPHQHMTVTLPIPPT
ncbi:unnamed protein product [Peniophora sp. CBMAI 1063]|nr:unnamed protein product [Peniophora sp. CBMAI 1063]